MAFRQLTVADGLSQNTVMDIKQDQFGYIWFATENGLDRYDGYNVHSYQRGIISEGDLANDYIWKIAEDAQSNLWLATEGGGVAHWDRDSDRFKHYRHDPNNPHSLSSDRTRTLIYSERGIWIGTHNAGLNLLDPVNGTVQRFAHDPNESSSLPGNQIYSLLEDTYGGVWIGTNAGLAWLQAGSQSFAHFQHDPDNEFSLSSNEVRSLHLDSHGRVWVGTLDGGLNVLDRRSGRFKRYLHDPDDSTSLSHNDVRAILEDDTGRLWVATMNGLNVLQPYSTDFERYYASDRHNGLSDSYLMSLFQDRGGVLWVGTRTGGVSRWNSRSWNFGHNKPDFLKSLNVLAIATDPEHLWLGTLGGGLIRKNRITEEIVRISTADPEYGLQDDRVMSLLVDSNGGLWAGTMENGVAWLPRNRETFLHLKTDGTGASEPMAKSAMAIFEDDDARIWIGSFGAGITRFDPATHEYQRFVYDPEDQSSFCGTQGRDFALDNTGNLWIATEQGLCRFDSLTGAFFSYQHDDKDSTSVADNSIFSLHRDGGGRLWAGTGGGGLSEVIQQPDGTFHFKTLTRRDGLASNMIYGVRSDGHGRLWISSNNGLTRYNPQTGEATNFRRAHGLQGEEYHYGATHQGADGRLYFGGSNGFNDFDPLEVSSIERPPPVVLTEILKINTPINLDRPLSATSSIELNYREPAITFQFAALDFTEPENNSYRYQLEGFDTDWIDAGNRSSVTYTNLRPDSYRFRVIAASSEGAWNNDGVSIGLKVAPAPWKNPWAYALYAMIAAGLFYRLISLQRRKLARQIAYRSRLEREVESRTEQLAKANLDLQRASAAKGEFLARMSHEIRSPIHGVLGMTELLTRTALSEKQAKFASTIRSSASSLLAIINDVLDFSKLETENMELDPIDTDIEEIVDDVISMFAIEAENKNLELVSRVPPNGVDRVIVDPMRLRQILVNLVNNAIKFTSRGRIELLVEQYSDNPDSVLLAFRVKDTGVGIAAESQAHIFDSFAQENPATARKFGGTGLGLSICKELVDLMNSQLNLTSVPGEGSTFSFQLSLKKPQGTVEVPDITLTSNVLLAVSEPALARQINHYLDAWGCRCDKPGNEGEALQLLSESRNGSKQYDLLIVSDKFIRTSSTKLLSALTASSDTGPKLLLMQSIGSSNQPHFPQDHLSLNTPLKRLELWHQLTRVLTPDTVSSTQPLMASNTDVNISLEDRRGRILVVEDSVVNQEVLTGMLIELGCSYALTGDGLSAIAAADAEKFDVILMDYQLPDIDGLETSRRIRTECHLNADTPVVILSANVTIADREQFLAEGLDDFLAKPCTLEQLSEKLAQWLAPLAEQPMGLKPEASIEQSDRTQATDSVTRIRLEYDDTALLRISGLKRPDGSNMLLHAVKLFQSSSRESIDSLKKAVAENETDTIRFIAHRLKSSCANLGAVSMANLCRDLEQTVHSRAAPELHSMVEQLAEQSDQVNDWLEERSRDSA